VQVPVRINGEWLTYDVLLRRLSDDEFRWLVEDQDSHFCEGYVFPLQTVFVCPGEFCRGYRKMREASGLAPDPDHQPWELGSMVLLEEARRREHALEEAYKRVRDELGEEAEAWARSGRI
jgi:hypothetical protein